MKSEKTILEITRQLLMGLTQIHDKFIVHRDLKLDNLLVQTHSDGTFQIKIADFGLSDCIKDQADVLHLKCGSPAHIAPEILRGNGYNTKADIFSLGTVLYYLATKRNIFE